MSLEEKLAATRAGAASRIPPERQAIMHRATEDLRRSGILDRIVPVGSPMPAFDLVNHDDVDGRTPGFEFQSELFFERSEQGRQLRVGTLGRPLDLEIVFTRQATVIDDGTAGDFEEGFVDIWPHACAFAGGDDDGGGGWRVPDKPCSVFRVPCVLFHAEALES